jgi:hypothetical protein
VDTAEATVVHLCLARDVACYADTIVRMPPGLRDPDGWLVEVARRAAAETVFEPNWESADGLRLVSAVTLKRGGERGEILAQDVPLEAAGLAEVGSIARSLVRLHGTAIEKCNLPPEVKCALLALVLPR